MVSCLFILFLCSIRTQIMTQALRVACISSFVMSSLQGFCLKRKQDWPQSGEGCHCPDTLLIALVVITPNKWDGPHHHLQSHKTHLPYTHSDKVSQGFLVSNYIVKELSHCKQLCCGKGCLPSEVRYAEFMAVIHPGLDQFVIGRNCRSKSISAKNQSLLSR